jgi:hypothetical protein
MRTLWSSCERSGVARRAGQSVRRKASPQKRSGSLQPQRGASRHNSKPARKPPRKKDPHCCQPQRGAATPARGNAPGHRLAPRAARCRLQPQRGVLRQPGATPRVTGPPPRRSPEGALQSLTGMNRSRGLGADARAWLGHGAYNRPPTSERLGGPGATLVRGGRVRGAVGKKDEKKQGQCFCLDSTTGIEACASRIMSPCRGEAGFPEVVVV